MKMKSAIIIPVILVAFSCLSATGQDQTNIPAGISIAIKAGNAAELAKYMNSTIELLLLDKEDFYKKNVAEIILKIFSMNIRQRISQSVIRVLRTMLNMPLATLRPRRAISVSISSSRKLIRNC